MYIYQGILNIWRLRCNFLYSGQIEDLLHNFGGQNWIDREVHGTLVAMSKIVETEKLRYMKVHYIEFRH